MRTELLQACGLCDSSRLEVLDPACHIARCRDCGYIFDNPRPTAEELAAFYSRPGKYDAWLDELEAREESWRRRLKLLQPTRRPGSLLDVGTGIGQFLAVARGAYAEVYGTEVSTTALEIARQRYGLDLFHGTIEELAARGRRFDNLTLFHVLEHVTDPRSVLRACHTLLVDGGILVIAVPNEVASLRGLKRRLLGSRAPGVTGRMGLPLIRLDGSLDEIHLSHFTPRVLRRLVTAAGFSVLQSALDPCYLRQGKGRWKDDLFYGACLAVRTLFRVNIYDAIMMVARKRPASPAAA